MLSFFTGYVWLPQIAGLFLLIFLLREILTFKNYLSMKYLFTPLVTMSVIAVVVLAIYHHGTERYILLILTGLIFALAADTLLMIVEVNLLKHGIIFFFMCHLFYIAAFSSGYLFSAYHLPVLGFLGVICFYVIRRTRGRTRGLDLPVALYVIISALMVFFAVTRAVSYPGAAGYAAAGALLFVISDVILAVNAFIRPIPRSTIFTWLLYGPAQFLIALSCFQ